ncbi:MAG: SOS response-associated peptidase family protein, partial [bacterium]
MKGLVSRFEGLDTSLLNDRSIAIPEYNDPGSQVIAVVQTAPSQYALRSMKWGVEFDGHTVYNARFETVDTKPAWRTGYLGHRVLVPVQTFYEHPNVNAEWKAFSNPTHQIMMLASIAVCDDGRNSVIVCTMNAQGEVAEV